MALRADKRSRKLPSRHWAPFDDDLDYGANKPDRLPTVSAWRRETFPKRVTRYSPPSHTAARGRP